MSSRAGRRPRVLVALRTAGVLALLLLALPFNLALTAIAQVRSIFIKNPRPTATNPKTILVSGGR